MYKAGRMKSQSEGVFHLNILIYITSCLFAGLDAAAGRVNKTDVCPENESAWNNSVQLFGKCTIPDESYHCLQTLSGSFMELCILPVWIKNGLCPRADQVDTKTRIVHVNCTSFRNECPEKFQTGYLSDEVYKYQGCFDRDIIKSSDVPRATTQGGKDKDKKGQNTPFTQFQQITIAIAAIFVILIIVIAVFCFALKGRKSGKMKQPEQRECKIGSHMDSQEYFDIHETMNNRSESSPSRHTNYDAFHMEGEYATSNFKTVSTCDSDSCYDFAMFR